jgi:hypothetical protein
MSFKMAPPKFIDTTKYLDNATTFARTAKAQASAYEEASVELEKISAKVDVVSKSSKPADEKSKELKEATKTFENPKNKIDTAKKTTAMSNNSLIALENELRKELAKDPKNEKLVSGGGMVDYKHLVSGAAIDNTDLTEEAKKALKKTVELITEARKACNDVEVASKKAEETKKDPKAVEAKITEVTTSIGEQKGSEERSAARAVAAAVQKEADAVRAQEAKKAQAAKDTAEKPAKDLKEALLKEVGARKSKGSMEAIVKIAEKAGLSGSDLKEVQTAAKEKTEKRSFVVKVADFFKKDSDKKEAEIGGKPEVAAAKSNMPQTSAPSKSSEVLQSAGRDPNIQRKVNGMRAVIEGKANAQASQAPATAAGKAQAQSKGAGR